MLPIPFISDQITFNTLSFINTFAYGWMDSILAPNGNIYCTPYTSNVVLKIASDDTFTTFGTGSVPNPTGLGNPRYPSGVLVGNNIYCSPNDAPSIMKINTTNDTITTIDPGTGLGQFKLGRPIAIGNIVYFPPQDAQRVLRLNTTTDTVTFIGPTFSTELSKFYNAACSIGNVAYFFPYNYENPLYGGVIKVNSVSDTVTTVVTDSLINGNRKFISAIPAPNGFIYLIPEDFLKIIKYNPTTDVVTSIGDDIIGQLKFSGALLNGNLIYCIPKNLDSIMVIDTTNDTYYFIDSGQGTGGFKWGTPVKRGNYIYACPLEAETILKISLI